MSKRKIVVPEGHTVFYIGIMTSTSKYRKFRIVAKTMKKAKGIFKKRYPKAFDRIVMVLGIITIT